MQIKSASSATVYYENFKNVSQYCTVEKYQRGRPGICITSNAKTTNIFC
jgi:hypothetical protein